MAGSIEQLLKDDRERHSYRFQSTTAADVERFRVSLVPEYANSTLGALRTGGKLRIFWFDQNEDNTVLYRDEALEAALLVLRRENGKVRGEKTFYPSRPLLTSLAVRRLVGVPALYKAHYSLGEPDGTARFILFEEIAKEVIDTVQCIDRAEGTIKTDARREALMAQSGLTEEQLQIRAARFQDHADRLMRDHTGITTVEGNLVKLAASMTGIPTLGEIRRARFDYPLVALAAQMLAIEAYRAIYPQTDLTNHEQKTD